MGLHSTSIQIIFFSKDAGELRFIILRRREGKIPPKKNTRETHSAIRQAGTVLASNNI